MVNCGSCLKPGVHSEIEHLSTQKLTSTRSSKATDLCARAVKKPILTPSDITPSHPELEVVGVLNPTFIELAGKRCLIARIDERPSPSLHLSAPNLGGAQMIKIALADTKAGGRVRIIEVQAPGSYLPDKEPILPESVREGLGKSSGALLSYISHLRVIELSGFRPSVHTKPLVFPSDEFSQFGCEDPRATLLEGRPVIAYTAVGCYGATGWFARLENPDTTRDKAILLGPDHKHSALFPEKINKYYYMISRPLSRTYIRLSGVWLFRSPDLTHWGRPCPILLPRSGMWDSVRVGPCTAPLHVARGWLFFYYGVDSEDSYHVGAALLDHEEPLRVVARSKMPVLSPVLEWERVGRRADTVFPGGFELLGEQDTILIYYGAADTCIGVAEVGMQTLLNGLVAEE